MYANKTIAVRLTYTHISNIIPFPSCLFCPANDIHIHIFTSLLFSFPKFLPGDLHRPSGPSVTGSTGFSHQEQFAIRAPGGAKGHVIRCCGRLRWMESSENGIYNMHFWPEIPQNSSHQYLYPQFVDSIKSYITTEDYKLYPVNHHEWDGAIWGLKWMIMASCMLFDALGLQ